MVRRSMSAANPLPSGTFSKLPQTAIARYSDIQLVARGGMGEVFKAVDRVLGRQVALKSILPECAADRKRQIRLRREIMAMAQVNHPNMVHLYDFCEDEKSACYVMEYVPGRTLDALLEDGPMKPATAVALIAQIADALTALHNERILHRDITPANIMIRPDGTAKLMDFGLVKMESRDDLTELTEKDCLIGTLLYLPPEYLRYQPWTERSDIYQLGAVLYRMITGKVPVQADKILSLRQGKSDITVAPPSAAMGRAYSTVDDIVMKTLNLEPKHRYKSAAELRDHCLAWLVSLDNKPMQAVEISDSSLTRASLLLSSNGTPKKVRVKRESDSSRQSGSQSRQSGSQSRRSGSRARRDRKVPTLVRMQLARHKEEEERLNRWRSILVSAAVLFIAAITTLKIATWQPSPEPAQQTHKSVVKRASKSMTMPKISKSALHSAAANGKLSETKKLLSAGVDLHGLDENGWTPLHCAVLNGQKAIAELLIEKGTHVEVTDDRGYTPLHWACHLGKKDLVELLLEKGATPNYGWGKCTALHACLNGNDKEMRKILKEFWRKNVQRGSKKVQKEIASMLLSKGADGNSKDQHSATALHLAAAEGLHDIVLAILHRGVNNIDAIDGQGETALHKAVRCKVATSLVQTLLGSGARADVKNNKGQTAYDLAIKAKANTVAALLKASMNQVN